MNKKKDKIYNCLLCDYKSFKLSNYNKHINTKKHISTTFLNNFEQKSSQENYICEKCKKNFNSRSGLWYHKNKCQNNIFNNNNNNNILQNDNIIKLIEQNTELITQNKEFKELLIEQHKVITELAKNTGNNNNNTNCNNKTFNLQVFLNEKCKDALNISEFVNSLKLTLEDLENVGDKGFVDGITRIFVNGLKKLDVYKRPIHCSDLKRETMYLKNENVWEKDDENKEQMKKVIKQIANKNINKIYEWKDKYPDCKYSDSKKNDQYLKILLESFGSKTKEEDQLLYEKIIKNIAKETMIDKNK